MSGKRKSGGGTWVDPDDSPELTDEWFDRADIYDGDKLVRRGKPPGDDKLALAARLKLGMSQSQFAKAISVPLATLKNWEQQRVRPDPAARSLLLIVHQEPEAALRALRRTAPKPGGTPKPKRAHAA